jgi:ribosomal protein L14E/L6E/L27E
MTQGDFDVGRVVVAKAGRDKGMEKPKKKKVKHLKPTPALDQNLKEQLESGARVLDADIRKSLQSLGYEK